MQTKTHLTLSLLLLTSVFIPLVTSAYTPLESSKPLTGQAFTTTLKQGSRGEEVKNLQILLNSDPDTRIAEKGIGSPGQETTYFGPATTKAVIKFQNKYAKDTLTPAGLTQGTGIVGALTRKKLSTLGTTPAPITTQPQTQTPAVSSPAFTKPLTLGMTDRDVQKLQIFLNKDPLTRIATTGPGSPGNETLYYGPATAKAVTKFQEKYKADILTPRKLTKGTGTLDNPTITKLNILIAPVATGSRTTPTTPTQTTQTTTQPQPTFSFGGGGGGGGSASAATPAPTPTPTPTLVNGAWSDWSACSVSSCGSTGTQERTCTNPTPANGGTQCSGASSQSCSTPACTPTTYTITATTGANGTVTPVGATTVSGGSTQSYTITPSAGYEIASITIDGALPVVPPVSPYTFTNIQGNHSIHATFTPIPQGALPITLPPAHTLPARTSGVAPLSVFFDATQTTANSTTRPFHELEYRWNFGDPLGSPVSGLYWNTGSNPGVNLRNEAMGPVAAHVYERPGTYQATLYVTDGTNTVSTTTQTITVEDPNVVFSGANTICVGATSLPEAGVGGCPIGARATSTPNFTNVINTYAKTGQRVLFKRGDTFETTTAVNQWGQLIRDEILTTGPGLIGAFGVGAPPTIQASRATAALFLSSQTTPNIKDWRVMDLNFIGANTSGASAISFAGGINQVTLLRLFAQQQGVSFVSVAGTLDANNLLYNHPGHAIWSQISLVDSIVDGTSPTAPGAGSYLGGEHFFFAGNLFDMHGTAQSNPSITTHTTRFWYLAKAVLNNNTLQHPGPGQAVVKLHGPTWCEDPITAVLEIPLPTCNYSTDLPYSGSVTTDGLGHGDSRWVVLSDNKYVSAYNGGLVYLAPQNGTRYERVRDVISERNLYVTENASVYEGLYIAGFDITARNEIFYSGTSTNNMTGVKIEKWGISPAPDAVHIYNNSYYSNYTSTINRVIPIRVKTGVSNIIIKNNLVYAPNDTVSPYMVQCYDQTGLTTNCSNIPTLINSNNSTDTPSGGQIKNTNPYITNAPLIVSDMVLSSGSYAIDTGTVVKVFSDFFKTLRPQGVGYDMGAVER